MIMINVHIISEDALQPTSTDAPILLLDEAIMQLLVVLVMIAEKVIVKAWPSITWQLLI